MTAPDRRLPQVRSFQIIHRRLLPTAAMRPACPDKRLVASSQFGHFGEKAAEPRLGSGNPVWKCSAHNRSAIPDSHAQVLAAELLRHDALLSTRGPISNVRRRRGSIECQAANGEGRPRLAEGNAFRQPCVVGSPWMILPTMRTARDARCVRDPRKAFSVHIDASVKIPVRHGATQHQSCHGWPPERPTQKPTDTKAFCSNLIRPDTREPRTGAFWLGPRRDRSQVRRQPGELREPVMKWRTLFSTAKQVRPPIEIERDLTQRP